MNNFTDQEKKWLDDLIKWYPSIIVFIWPDDFGESNRKYFIELTKHTSPTCYATVRVSEDTFRLFAVQVIRAVDFLTDYTRE